MTWDGRDDGGSPVGSGIYFVRRPAAGHAWSQKITVIRQNDTDTGKVDGLPTTGRCGLRCEWPALNRQYAFVKLVSVVAMFCFAMSPGSERIPQTSWLPGIGLRTASAQASRTGVDALVSAPGSSNSIAAGVWNPAAWPIQRRGGLHLAWNTYDPSSGQSSDLHDFRGVLSFGHLGFSMRRLSLAGREHYDYTTGIGWGNRANTGGISYSWSRGATSTFGWSERITVGSIHRWRPVSVGLVRTWERAGGDNYYQADLGIRPIGPRWTFFADTQKFDDADWDEVVFALGTEVQIHEGLSAAMRWQDDDQISLKLELAFPGLRPSYRHHLDNDSYRASTYAVEMRSGPDFSYGSGQGTRFPTLDLKGPLAYRTYRYFDGRRRLIDLLRQIDSYANDPRVGGVVLKTSGMRMSAASMWEVRAQLEGLRAEDKTVVLYLDRMSTFAYSLATVADEIWMDPAGRLDLRGLNFGRTYYRRLLDKLGVGVEEWRYFTYKSAVETLVRTSMSDADREQTEALLDDLYEELIAQIMNSRGIDRERWNEIVDERGFVLAEAALELGLIDRIGSFEDANEAAREAEVRVPVGGRPRGTDIVSTQSVAQLGTLFGDPIWGSEEWGEPAQIGVLYAIGVCAMDSGIQGRRLSRAIRSLREDPKIKAIVLRVDSPGGDPLPSDLVAREIRETTKVKPVIISQGQIAASGGYWISMYADRILASPFTITGSIGVINMNIWDAGIGDKLGMDYDSVQRGLSADLGAGPSLPGIGLPIPRRPLTPLEKVRAEEVIRHLYRGFVRQVATGRGMEEEEVDAVAQGRIWSGRAGVAVELVDEIGGLWRAIEIAKEDAGIPSGRAVQLVQGPSLGAFDGGQFFPRIPGLSFLTRNRAGSGGADPASGLVAPEPDWMKWGRQHGLGLSESLYMGTLLTRLGEPMLLMAPFSLESVTDVR